MKNKLAKTIQIKDVYSWSDLVAQLPFCAESVYSIKMGTYGFLHDVGTEIVLTLSSNPTGWETVKADFQQAVKHCQDCWNMAAKAAYH